MSTQSARPTRSTRPLPPDPKRAPKPKRSANSHEALIFPAFHHSALRAPPAAPHLSKTKKSKKEYIFEELVNTDERYVQRMQHLVDYFMVPLAAAGLSRADSDVIFANIKQIIKLHRELQAELKKAGLDGAPKVLLHFGAAFEIYPGYISTYDLGTQRVHQIIEGKECSAELKQALNGIEYEGIPESWRALEELRAAAVKRLPLMTLMLRGLAKEFPQDDPRKQRFSAAAQEYQRITAFINSKKKERELSDRLLYIRDHLVGSKRSLRETNLAVVQESQLEAHQWSGKHARRAQPCELCDINTLAGARVMKCDACGLVVHPRCTEDFPDDCSGILEGSTARSKELLLPHRKILEEAQMLHKSTPLDEPKRYTMTAFEEGRTVVLFPDSLLVLADKGANLEIIELVKWKSRHPGVAPAGLREVSETIFSLANYKLGTLHSFQCASEEQKSHWVQVITLAMDKWSAWSDAQVDRERRVVKHLRGVKARIEGVVPVQSAQGKSFSVYMIALFSGATEAEPITILKRYPQLLALQKLLHHDFHHLLPAFPSKSVFNSSEKHEEKRKRKLELWLNALLDIAGILKVDAVRKFLTTTVSTEEGQEEVAVSNFGMEKLLDTEGFFYSANISKALGTPAVLLYDFAGAGENQFEAVGCGEEVMVLSSEAGWSWCRRLSDGGLGYLPSDFLSTSSLSESQDQVSYML